MLFRSSWWWFYFPGSQRLVDLFRQIRVLGVQSDDFLSLSVYLTLNGLDFEFQFVRRFLACTIRRFVNDITSGLIDGSAGIVIELEFDGHVRIFLLVVTSNRNGGLSERVASKCLLLLRLMGGSSKGIIDVGV